jgi:hypothetical protein
VVASGSASWVELPERAREAHWSDDGSGQLRAGEYRGLSFRTRLASRLRTLTSPSESHGSNRIKTWRGSRFARAAARGSLSGLGRS